MKKVWFIALGGILFSCSQPTEKAPVQATLGFDLANLDTSVSPCDDFFQYIAGGWVKQNPIPNSESRWSNAGILVESNNEKVRGLLDSISKAKDVPQGSYAALLATYYNSGMDSASVEASDLTALKEVFARIEGITSHQEYAGLLGLLKANGMAAPLSSYVGADDKNSNKHVLQIGQSGLGLPDRDYYLVDNERFQNIRKEYVLLVQDMLEYSGYSKGEAKKAAAGIMAFERSLAEVYMARAESRIPENTYNKMTVEAFAKLAPNVRIEEYLKVNKVSVDSVIVGQPNFFKGLSTLLPRQEVSVLQAYAKWHVLRSYTAQLPNRYVQRSFDFYGKVLSGTNEMKPRWKRTINQVEGGLGDELGRLFVERYFPEESKAAVEKLVENLRVAYGQRIEALEWMSPDTKKRAKEKLSSFTYKIGYPNQWQLAEGLPLKADAYLQNSIELSRYEVKENLAKLGTPVDRNEWFMPAHIVNAYYNPSYNEVVFPAGILQPPFYDPQADAAINFGGIGGVIGHEFTHGFDDQGSKYNADGNLENWWKPEDSTSFASRTELMVVQYGGYEPIMGTFVNGALTLGENIADLGGLTLAYYGYKNGVENGTYRGDVIEGFTWQQRIFMGWGQVWQSAQKDAYTANQVLTDPHSPARYRVVGPMSNMPEFAEAWGCSPGDAMVRADSVRIQIW
jgi:putative endopeptidase